MYDYRKDLMDLDTLLACYSCEDTYESEVDCADYRHDWEVAYWSPVVMQFRCKVCGIKRVITKSEIDKAFEKE